MSVEFEVIGAAGAVLAVAVKLLVDLYESKKVDEKVSAAEKEAFLTIPEQAVAKTNELLISQEQLEQRTKEIEKLIKESQSALQMGSLFNLYNKQIEKYQTETQSRAGWSFIFAIVAMVAGLGFVFWGGTHIITGDGWPRIAAGSAISTIGGTISAFIAKTFMDVHRLSLTQLNHYFRQPVLNSNILTAQRLADLVDDNNLRQEKYGKILTSVLGLIKDGDTNVPTPVVTTSTRSRSPKASTTKEVNE